MKMNSCVVIFVCAPSIGTQPALIAAMHYQYFTVLGTSEGYRTS